MGNSKECNLKRKAAGLCRDCPQKAYGKARCTDCIKRSKNRLKKRGRCVSCGGVKSNNGYICHKCVFKNVAYKQLNNRSRWEELKALFEKQNGRCAVTGLEIQLGNNASIDHIIPTSRGGQNDIENLRWVHITFNRIKNNMTDGEMLSWIDRIIQHKHKLQLGPPEAPNAPDGDAHWPSGTKTDSTGYAVPVEISMSAESDVAK